MGHRLLFLVMGNELHTCIWHWSFWYDDMIYVSSKFLFSLLSNHVSFLFCVRCRGRLNKRRSFSAQARVDQACTRLHRILHLAPASFDDEPSTLILQIVELSTLISD